MESLCLIQTPTPNLRESQEFYERIGFFPTDDSRLIWTDGKALVEINPDRFARAGIKLFKHSWSYEVALLEQTTNVIRTDFGFLLADPSGTWIYLFEKDPVIKAESQTNRLGLIGNFHGISLETMDIVKSSQIFEILGFILVGGSKEQGYVTYASGDFSVSLMKPLTCPHLFFNPSLNYFNGQKNLTIIAKLRELGVAFSEEITFFNSEGTVDNISVRDPGGLGFFIFSD